MEIITELDGYQAALRKINMNEAVMPYVNGRLVSDKAYNKVQKLLNCPEMIASHKYLYNLDLDQLTEDEETKIDQLYALGCDRGFIVDDLTQYNDEISGDNTQCITNDANKNTTQFKSNTPCWTIIYSATGKDGQIKTGEAYSNALSADAAKADINSKLTSIGYSNISILAIEQCESTPNSTCTSIPEADEESETEETIDNSSDDESNNSTSDSGDDSNDEESEEDSDDEESEDDSDDEESEEDSTDEESEDDSDDEESEDDSDDEESEEDSDDEESDEDSDDEESEDDSDDENKEELDPNKKAELKDQYRRTFKNTLVKCKFKTSFNDLTLEQKVKFFTALAKAWTKNEPNEFMTDKEIEQLNNVVIKEEND